VHWRPHLETDELNVPDSLLLVLRLHALPRQLILVLCYLLLLVCVLLHGLALLLPSHTLLLLQQQKAARA
jgi:hypothetical protein